MNPTRLIAAFAFLFTLGSASPAWAQLFSYQLRTAVLTGDQPTVVVIVNEDFRALDLQLTRDDGQTFELGGDPARAGSQVELSWRQPEGVHRYRATLRGHYGDDDSYDMNFNFEAFVGPGLEMEIPRDTISLDDMVLSAIPSRDAVKAEVTIIGLEGPLAEEVFEDLEAPAGAPIELDWIQRGRGEVVRIDVRTYDRWGFWAEEKISPWSLEVPHEDVVFDTNEHQIRADQEPSLADALGIIQENISRYGQLIDIKLYIAGYTDTVGDPASNQSLSERRARSISAWFQQNGVQVPIFYQGYGESALAVPTDDSVDEERNRRAVYYLATEAPQPSGTFPRRNWRPL